MGAMFHTFGYTVGHHLGVDLCALAAGVLAPIGILLSPAVGALFMSLSTVVVAINAQLLRRLDLQASTTSTEERP